MHDTQPLRCALVCVPGGQALAWATGEYDEAVPGAAGASISAEARARARSASASVERAIAQRNCGGEKEEGMVSILRGNQGRARGRAGACPMNVRASSRSIKPQKWRIWLGGNHERQLNELLRV